MEPIKVELSNWGPIQKAALTISGVTCVMGDNEMGKSTLLNAIGRCASVNEKTKITTGDKNDLVMRESKGKTFVKLVRGESSRCIYLPSGKIEQDSWPEEMSIFAVGIEDATALKPAELNKVMLSYLDTRPTAKELADALDPYGYSKAEVDQILQHIEEHGDNGWDSAWESYKSSGTKKKGQWEEVTGASFQPAKGAEWEPPNFESDLVTTSELTLTTNLADAESELERLFKDQAVDDSNYAGLQEKWLGHDRCKSNLATATEQREKSKECKKVVEVALDKARQAFREIPTMTAGTKPETITCHKCGTECLKEDGGKPASYKGPSKEDLKKNQDLRAEANRVVDKAKADFDLAENNVMKHSLSVNNCEKEIAACVVAHEELMAAQAIEKGTVTTEQVEAQRNIKQHCVTRLEAYRKWSRAQALFKAFEKNQYLINVLAPDGLRQKKLASAVKEFSEEYLAKTCDLAGWDTLELHPDMTFTFGEFLLKNRSTAARFKARVTMQFALACLKRQPFVLIDAADVLGAKGRRQLFSLLKEMAGIMPSVVTMTKSETAECPDLLKMGFGVSYWIQDRQLKELSAVPA